MHIPKIFKIIIPALIVISVVLSPFVGVFDVRVEATTVTKFLQYGLPILYVVFDCASELIGSTDWNAFGEATEKIMYSEVYGMQIKKYQVDKFIKNTAEDLNYIPIETVLEHSTDENGKLIYKVKSVIPNDECSYAYTDEEWAYVDEMCAYVNDYLAKGGDEAMYFEEYSSGMKVGKLGLYGTLKEDIKNAMLKDSYQKYVESVGGAIGEGTPVYEGSLFGPLASIAFPALSYSTGQIKDGFYFSPTVSSSTFFQGCLENDDDYYWYATENSAIMSPYTSIKEFMKRQLNGVYKMTYRVIIDDGHNHYGTSFYVIYNNEIYYNGNCKHNTISNDCYSLPGSFNSFNSYSSSSYSTVDGKELDLAPGASFKFGVCINLENPGCYYPSVADVPEDKTEMGDSTTVEIPRSEDEETIANAIGVGLINENSPVTLDSEGNIAQVDGITLDKLNEILELIKEGNLDFENVQEYLNLITQLISSGNLTAKQQEVLLDNINDSIKELTDGLTADDDYVLDIPEFGEIEVTAGGLDEVVDTVDVALPIVGQAKELIINLFNWGNYSSSTPPNFNFYWDSNKDGVVEKYCWLNLSFMETKLTNTNLEDKGRFRKQMTVREFLQSLIVLVIYALFAIKVLRKLPGLIGAGESGTDDIAVIDNYTRRH